MSIWFVLAVRRSRRAQRSDGESMEDWSELDENEWRFGQRILFGLFICIWFITCLMVFGIAAFFVAGPMPLSVFILFQLQLLVGSVTDVFAPTKEPSRAVMLLTRKKP